MKNLFLTFSFILFTLFSFAQTTTVTGVVMGVDQGKSEALAFVSVSLHATADSLLLMATASDNTGNFSLEIASADSVLVYFNIIGFKPMWKKISASGNLNLGTIELMRTSAVTSEMEFVAKKPLVQVQADKTIFNVEGTANAVGLNALELLRRAPGVVIDNNNNISVKGKSGITVYIDGRISPLQGSQLSDFLKSTPSSSIEKIEIITNPSARFDAAGTAGILNIVMKKNSNYGQNATFGLGYGNQVYGKTNGSFTYNRRKGKTNVYATYGNNFSEDWGYMRFYKEQNDVFFDQRTYSLYKDQSHYGKAGIDISINDKNTVGISVNTNLANNISDSHGSTPIGSVALGAGIDSTLEASSISDGYRNNYGANVNYQWKGENDKEFTVDANYGIYDIDNKNFQPNRYIGSNGILLNERNYQNNTATQIDIAVVRADYSFNWKKIKWEAGVKGTQVNTNNKLDFFNVVGNNLEVDSNLTNSFEYKERVLAAYANASGKYKKFGWQVGVRAENTNSNGELFALTPQPLSKVDRLYTNLFPSAAITFDHKETSTFNLTYSRRIDRPSYQSLNPFESRLDELSYSRGNAFLQPQYTDAFELSHTLFYMVTSSIGYSKTNGFFTEITDTTEFSRSFIQTRNLGYRENITLNIGSPVTIAKWWDGYVNMGVYNIHNRATFEDGNTIDLRATSYNIFMQNTFKFNKTTSFELSGFFNGPSVWGGTFRNKPMGGLDVAFQKTFLSEKLVLRLAYGDILRTMRWRGISQYAGLYMDASGLWESRTARINLTWKIGNQKLKEKKASQVDEFKRVK
jgi:iron complex outermembrane receptor protein